MTTITNMPTARLAGFYFLYFALLGAFMPYWSLYLEALGFSKADIGIFASIGLGSRIIAPSLWGYIADKTGRYMRVVQISALAQVLTWILVIVSPKRFGVLAFILFLSTFFQYAILAQFEAVSLAWLGKQQHRYGQLRLWGSLGFAAAVLALGYAFDQRSILILPTLLLLFALAATVNAFMIAEPQKIVTHESGDMHSSFFLRLKQPKIIFFFLIVFLLLLSHAPFYTFYSNYLQGYGYSKTRIGCLWTVGIAAEIVMFTQTKHIVKQFNEYHLLLLCVCATGVRWLLVALLPQFIYIQIASQLIHALSFALFHTLVMRMILREFNPNQQGSAQGLYNTMWGLGVALGSWVAGLFWQSLTGQGIFLLAAGVCFVGFIPVYGYHCQSIKIKIR